MKIEPNTPKYKNNDSENKKRKKKKKNFLSKNYLTNQFRTSEVIDFISSINNNKSMQEHELLFYFDVEIHKVVLLKENQIVKIYSLIDFAKIIPFLKSGRLPIGQLINICL